MFFQPEDLPYLRGETFSSGRHFKLVCDEADTVYRSRVDWLIDLCRGRRVIHVGCVDHSPDILSRKRRRRKWLHAELVAVTARCYGVDIEEEGVRFMREHLGFTDVAAGDILALDTPPLRDTDWDQLLLGEVLEHVDSPIEFLRTIRQRFTGRVRELIITVPNAFARENFVASAKTAEAINSDHRYWFTPFTITKVVCRAGFEPRLIRMARHGIVKRRSIWRNYMMRLHPLWRNSIILVADFPQLHAILSRCGRQPECEPRSVHGQLHSNG